jgi:hypothetical protein
MKRIIIAISFILFIVKLDAQFIGHSGVYYLGSADVAIAASKYTNPCISGVVCRFKWEALENTPNVYDWSFIDGEILKAKNAKKKISLQPLGVPSWMKTIPNVETYYYIDKNTFHSTYGQIVSDVIPWGNVYLDRLKLFIQQLANKYANDTTVSYVNAIGGNISRGLPDSVLTDTILKTKTAFWKKYNYSAETVASKMYPIIDFYMSKFPKTPLWCSVDYVLFEMKASGHAPNYLATLYTNYGITNYPDRFGLFREDIAGCTLIPPQTGNQWFIMKNNPTRTGAQMLWSVQDGPDRMNKCGITPNTKQQVLDSAVNKGLDFGMRYLEIYGADIDDISLSDNIRLANLKLIAKGKEHGSTRVETIQKKIVNVFPNPANNFFTVQMPNTKFGIVISDISGRTVLKLKNIDDKVDISCLNFPNGFYIISIEAKDKTTYHSAILKKANF